jgi:hypothetical protein
LSHTYLGAGAHAAKLAKTTAHRPEIGLLFADTQQTVVPDGSEQMIVARTALFGNLDDTDQGILELLQENARPPASASWTM